MNANHLLLWLSQRREGSWGQFRSAVDQFAAETGCAGSGGSVVGVSERFPLHQQCRLNLQKLAHVEFHAAENALSWRVVPPALALNKVDGYWRGVVCGARWPGLEKQLRSSRPAGLRLEVRQQFVAPDAYLLEAEDAKLLTKVANDLGFTVQLNSSLALLMCVPAIAQQLPRLDSGLPHGSDWDSKRFSARSLSWVSASRLEAEREKFGLYRFIFRHDRRYLLCTSAKANRVANQLGKFLVLRKRRRRVLRYSSATQSLTIPAICQPPPLVERAIILRSGCLPNLEEDSHSLVYGCIDHELARAAARLLGQSIR